MGTQTGKNKVAVERSLGWESPTTGFIKGFQQDVKRVCSSASSALNPEFSVQQTPHHPHPCKSYRGGLGGNPSCRAQRHCQPPALIPGRDPDPGRPRSSFPELPGCGEPALPPVPPTAPGQTQHESPTAWVVTALLPGEGWGHEMPHPAAHRPALAPRKGTIP